MSYMDTHAAFAPAGGIQELSFDEVEEVGGGNKFWGKVGVAIGKALLRGAAGGAGVAVGAAAVTAAALAVDYALDGELDLLN